MSNGTSDVTTEGIRVQVAAAYLPQRSNPEQDQFLFAYRVILSNEGTEPARLLSRHWIIRDADNECHEVSGPGVINQCPDLAPGEGFTYTSMCPLGTPWGTMEGSYTMVRPDGRQFAARIGRFFLAQNLQPFQEE